MKHNKLILYIFLLFSSTCFAQQEAMYTHYMYNTLTVNPAYAGSRNALTLTGLNRLQWLGFEGAPITQTLTAHTPVYKDAVNLGLSFINDKTGPVRNTSLYLDYAFRFKVNEKSKLALGLKMGFSNYNSSLSELELVQVGDAAYKNVESVFLANFGFGLYFSQKRFYAGFSIPRLLANDYEYKELNNTYSLVAEQRHYYVIAGAMLPLKGNMELKPTCLLKATPGAPVEADFSAELFFQEKFSLGMMVRTGDALGVLVGYNLNDQFNLGYSYDWSFANNTAKYNFGSHEIVLRYDFIYKEKETVRSPRYF